VVIVPSGHGMRHDRATPGARSPLQDLQLPRLLGMIENLDPTRREQRLDLEIRLARRHRSILVGLAPAIRARRAPKGERFGLGAAAGGALLPLLLLDFAASKRDVSLIPLLSPLAILAARTLHRAVAPRLTAALGLAAALGVLGRADALKTWDEAEPVV